MKGTILISVMLLSWAFCTSCNQEQLVTPGCQVCINYRLFNGNGVRFDGNNQPGGRIPLCLKAGNFELIKSMDDELLNMTVGSSKTVKIRPEHAYGDNGLYYVDHYADTTFLVSPGDTLTLELEVLSIN